MNKLLLAFALLLLIVSSASAQSLDDLDAKNGFRDLKFGQAINTVKGLVPLSKDVSNDKDYRRPTDVLKIAGEPLLGITLTFYRSVLSSVRVKYATPAARIKLMQSLQIAYGYGVDSTLTAGPNGTVWIGKLVSMAIGDDSPGKGELLIQSTLVADLKKQDVEAAYKKRTGGL